MERQTAYQNALNKANAENPEAFKVKDVSVPAPPPILEEDDDAFLQQSLARARRVALQSKDDGDSNKQSSEQKIVEEVLASRKLGEEAVVAKADGDESIVFTSTGEFSRRLQHR